MRILKVLDKDIVHSIILDHLTWKDLSQWDVACLGSCRSEWLCVLNGLILGGMRQEAGRGGRSADKGGVVGVSELERWYRWLGHRGLCVRELPLRLSALAEVLSCWSESSCVGMRSLCVMVDGGEDVLSRTSLLRVQDDFSIFLHRCHYLMTPSHMGGGGMVIFYYGDIKEFLSSWTTTTCTSSRTSSLPTPLLPPPLPVVSTLTAEHDHANLLATALINQYQLLLLPPPDDLSFVKTAHLTWSIPPIHETNTNSNSNTTNSCCCCCYCYSLSTINLIVKPNLPPTSSSSWLWHYLSFSNNPHLTELKLQGFPHDIFGTGIDLLPNVLTTCPSSHNLSLLSKYLNRFGRKSIPPLLPLYTMFTRLVTIQLEGFMIVEEQENKKNVIKLVNKTSQLMENAWQDWMQSLHLLVTRLQGGARECSGSGSNGSAIGIGGSSSSGSVAGSGGSSGSGGSGSVIGSGRGSGGSGSGSYGIYIENEDKMLEEKDLHVMMNEVSLYLICFQSSIDTLSNTTLDTLIETCPQLISLNLFTSYGHMELTNESLAKVAYYHSNMISLWIRGRDDEDDDEEASRRNRCCFTIDGICAMLRGCPCLASLALSWGRYTGGSGSISSGSGSGGSGGSVTGGGRGSGSGGSEEGIGRVLYELSQLSQLQYFLFDHVPESETTHLMHWVTSPQINRQWKGPLKLGMIDLIDLTEFCFSRTQEGAHENLYPGLDLYAINLLDDDITSTTTSTTTCTTSSSGSSSGSGSSVLYLTTPGAWLPSSSALPSHIVEIPHSIRSYLYMNTTTTTTTTTTT